MRGRLWRIGERGNYGPDVLYVRIKKRRRRKRREEKKREEKRDKKKREEEKRRKEKEERRGEEKRRKRKGGGGEKVAGRCCYNWAGQGCCRYSGRRNLELNSQSGMNENQEY